MTPRKAAEVKPADSGKPKPQQRKLTAKQEKFAHEYGDGCSGAEAYRRAYNAKGMTPTQCTREAVSLLKNHTISSLAAQIKKDVDGDAVKHIGLTREFVIEGLLNIHKLAIANGKDSKNLAAANKALELLGKVDTISLFEERTRNIEERFVIGGAPEGSDDEDGIEAWAENNRRMAT